MHPTCAQESCPLFHIRDNLPSKTFTQKELPSQFEIDLPNTHCNIGGTKPTADTACIMCERAAPNFVPQIDRLPEVCEALKPYVKYIDTIHVQGVAEPFWQGRIFDCLEALGVDKYKDQIVVSTTTNGTVIDAKKMEKWLAYPKSCATFSLDAATPETYQKIRRLNAYHAVIKTMLRLNQQRTGQQKMYIHNNINLLNIAEVSQMVETAAMVGADSISFQPTSCLPGLEVSASNLKQFNEAETQILESADRLGVTVEFWRKLTLDIEPTLVQLKV